MLTGPLLSMLRFICVEGRKKKEKPAKTKAEFLLQLFETINEPRCDVVGFFFLLFIFFLFYFSFPHPTSLFLSPGRGKDHSRDLVLCLSDSLQPDVLCLLECRTCSCLAAFPCAAWLSLCAGLSIWDGHRNLSLQSQHLSY